MAAVTSMSDDASASAPERWAAPALEGDGGLMTAEKLLALQKDAYDEAYQVGLQEGRDAGNTEAAEKAARLEQILQNFARPLDELDEAVVQELVELAALVVRQLFRREIAVEPTHIIGVVREAVQKLPIAEQDVRVQLHPEDATLIRETLAPADGERHWTLVEDPLIARGGCQIVSGFSRIDASAETRLNAILSQLTGERRSDAES